MMVSDREGWGWCCHMGSYEAVKVRLDPTPRQERLMASHAGAARFAYNAGLAHVKEALDNGESPKWSHYDLRRWWNEK